MNDRIIAIHQPNFFPWIGYFDKIRRSDVFIFLNDVSYPRSGSSGMGSWCNRVKLLINSEPKWVTCPLNRIAIGVPISLVTINNDKDWRKKIIRTLEVNYRKAPNYTETMSLLVPLINSSEENLSLYNANAIMTISNYLGYKRKFIFQSDLKYTSKGTDLLIELVKSSGGSCYLCGDGAAGYQIDELFLVNKIQLIKQNFITPPYGNPTRFVVGLSIIDYLMWK